MKWFVTGGVTAIIILSIIATLYLTGGLVKQANVAENGLEFSMSVNATSIVMGEAIIVNMSVFNTLGRADVVVNQSEWTNSSFWSNQCFIGGGMGPFGIAVLRGFYDIDNYSKGTPLKIFPSLPQAGINPCNYYIRESAWLSSTVYSFEPRSDVARLETTGQSVPMAIAVIVGPLSYKLPIGQYTVIGGDEWGSLGVYHFEVSQG